MRRKTKISTKSMTAIAPGTTVAAQSKGGLGGIVIDQPWRAKTCWAISRCWAVGPWLAALVTLTAARQAAATDAPMTMRGSGGGAAGRGAGGFAGGGVTG